MKNITIILAIIFSTTVFNCTSNDDSSNPIPIEQNSLVGTWNLDYYIENNNLIEEIECNRQLNYRFLSNNTYTLTTFAGEDLNNCSIALIYNGTWEYLGENQFSLLVNGASTEEEVTITYQDNFTSFKIIRSSVLTEVYERE